MLRTSGKITCLLGTELIGRLGTVPVVCIVVGGIVVMTLATTIPTKVENLQRKSTFNAHLFILCLSTRNLQFKPMFNAHMSLCLSVFKLQVTGTCAMQ